MNCEFPTLTRVKLTQYEILVFYLAKIELIYHWILKHT